MLEHGVRRVVHITVRLKVADLRARVCVCVVGGGSGSGCGIHYWRRETSSPPPTHPPTHHGPARASRPHPRPAPRRMSSGPQDIQQLAGAHLRVISHILHIQHQAGVENEGALVAPAGVGGRAGGRAGGRGGRAGRAVWQQGEDGGPAGSTGPGPRTPTPTHPTHPPTRTHTPTPGRQGGAHQRCRK